MTSKPTAAFLDFATIGPGIDTSRLSQLVDLSRHEYSAPEEVADRLVGQDIAIVNKTRLGREVIAEARQLKLIVLAATGSDNVDSEAAAERGVGVANIRDYCSRAVAQHVFALILGLTQQIAPYTAQVRAGDWSRSRTFALLDHPIRELFGRVLGIVGYGALGRAVAELGRCLGMQVLIAARPGSDPANLPRDRHPLDSLLEQADVLSLHCPLTDETRHMLGEAEFRRMKSDAIVINTARGGLIEPHALAAALRSHEIAGAGIDVLATEPPPVDDPLLAEDIPNLIVTPHIAWAARESRQRALDQVAENIESFLTGGRLRRLA